jgi:hypothetical protein
MLEVKNVAAVVVIACAMVFPCAWSVALLVATTGNAVLVLPALKLLWRQPRPVGSGRTDWGMPSSHATELSLIGLTAVAWLVLVWGQGRSFSETVAAASLGLLVPAALAECPFRVRQRLHTRGQVLVGTVLGLSMAGFVVSWALACEGRMPECIPTW